jgi:hypothetical protein
LGVTVGLNVVIQLTIVLALQMQFGIFALGFFSDLASLVPVQLYKQDNNDDNQHQRRAQNDCRKGIFIKFLSLRRFIF